MIWTNSVRDHVAGNQIEELKQPRPRRATNANSDRLPFDLEVGFDDLTHHALQMAEDLPGIYAQLLQLLSGCHEADHGPLLSEQRRGASYKRLAAIAHAVGFSYEKRQEWYRVAEAIPLADRHAGHILSMLKREAA